MLARRFTIVCLLATLFGIGFAMIVAEAGRQPRHWDEVSADTGIGNPRRSTPEKGERYVKAVVEQITELLVEMKHTE